MQRTLVYKMAREGDPDRLGCFGIRDHMGEIRNLKFDAVIGIGGIGSDAKRSGIASRVVWIGMSLHRQSDMPNGWRGDLVISHEFLYLGNRGPKLCEVAPHLAKLMYANKSRKYLSSGFDQKVMGEIQKLLAIAKQEVLANQKAMLKISAESKKLTINHPKTSKTPRSRNPKSGSLSASRQSKSNTVLPPLVSFVTPRKWRTSSPAQTRIPDDYMRPMSKTYDMPEYDLE